MSGGTTQNADDGRIYVVRANGSVVSGYSSAWFKGKDDMIRPGDTVVVPLDARADAAVADVDGDHDDHLQPRDLGRGDQFVLMRAG